MALDFHYHPDVQDVQDIPDVEDLPDLPPFAPQLRREEHWEPEIPRMRVSELKQRLTAALSRTNTPLTSNEQRALREALDKLVKEMSEGWVLIDDMYEIPLILSQVEAITLGAKRGIRGNGGSRRCRNKKRTLRKKKRTLRKKKRTLSKRSFKKRSF